MLRRFEALALLPDSERFKGYIERTQARKWEWSADEILDILPQDGADIQLCKHRKKRYGDLLKFTHPKGARVYLKVDSRKLKRFTKALQVQNAT